MKKAIVLSGGGAKGAYQIGVWKALRKINYKFDIVTGTSIGALNGVLIVQGDYKKAYKIWEKISFRDVFGTNIDDGLNIYEKKKMVTNIVISNVFSKEKFSSNNIDELLDKILDYKKFYKSKIDFGFVTVNLTELRFKTLTKEKVPKEHLKDYLIGSSSLYPGLSKKVIDNSSYIDGGFYDNLPINLAIDMGAREVVAVDLKAPGIKQKVKDKTVKVKYIYPKVDLGPVFLFDKSLAKRNMLIGYYDCLKAFDRLDGNKYTFIKGELDKLLEIYKINVENNLIKELGNKKVLKKIDKTLLIDVLDLLGDSFSMDITKVYSIKKFNKSILKKIDTVESFKINTLFSKLDTKKRSGIIKYFYEELVKNNGRINNKILSLSVIFINELLAAFYVFDIEKGK